MWPDLSASSVVSNYNYSQDVASSTSLVAPFFMDYDPTTYRTKER